MDGHLKNVVSNMMDLRKKKNTPLHYMSVVIDTKPAQCKKPNHAMMFFMPSGLYNCCYAIGGRGIAAFHFPWFEKFGNPHASILLREGNPGLAISDRTQIV